jgi:hypothetical protein
MSTALQSLQEQIKAELAVVRKSVAPPSSNKISTRDKKFTLPGGQVVQGALECVILDHRNLHQYYTKPYDPQNPSPPDCFAIAKEFSDLSPHNHEGVSKPQHDQCAGCPMNEFGTARVGKGKACQNKVKLAVVPPDAGPDADILTLEIPASSLKYWNKLVSGLESAGRLPIQAIVSVSFNSAVSYPQPMFEVIGAVDDLETKWALREQAQSVLDAEPVGN